MPQAAHLRHFALEWKFCRPDFAHLPIELKRALLYICMNFSARKPKHPPAVALYLPFTFCVVGPLLPRAVKVVTIKLNRNLSLRQCKIYAITTDPYLRLYFGNVAMNRLEKFSFDWRFTLGQFRNQIAAQLCLIVYAQ